MSLTVQLVLLLLVMLAISLFVFLAYFRLIVKETGQTLVNANNNLFQLLSMALKEQQRLTDLLVSKGPMEFQTIQAMSQEETRTNYSDSEYVSQGTDEAETAHWLSAQNKDDQLDDYATDFTDSGITPAIGE